MTTPFEAILPEFSDCQHWKASQSKMIQASTQIVCPDGQAIELLHWEGGRSHSDAPVLHWAHATGFHAKTYAPLLRQLVPHFKVMSWDMRGHGQSRQAGNPEGFRGWQTYYEDLVAVVDHSPQPLWLAGHSIGATASLAAAVQRPNKVLGLVLLDPVFVDARQGWALRLARWFGLSHRIAIAAAAARRKSVFATHEEAFQNFRSKKVFGSWSDEWLRSYVDHGFVPQGDRIELACSPAWESLTFQHTEADATRWIRKLDCPVHVLAAGKGSTFPASAHARLLKNLPGTQITVRPDASHFLPMEHTDWVVGRMLEAEEQRSALASRK